MQTREILPAAEKREVQQVAKKLKKAFTITELVIVIAVVAILAAVLIPTFANIIDKANESSDTQAVREMNLALENAEILEGKAEDLTDALEVLADAGMDANAYKALSKGRKFVWDSSINRVLYVTDNNKVLYPQEYKDTIYTFGTWITLTGRMAGDDSWKDTDVPVASYALPNEQTVSGTFTKYTVSTNAQLMSLSESLRAGEFANKGAGLIIELEQDAEIDLLGAEWLSIGEFAGIFNGNGATISNLTMTDRTQDCVTEFSSTTGNNYRPYGFVSVFEGPYFGNVTFADVNISFPGNIPELSANHTVAAAIGAVRNTTAGKTTYVDNITVSGNITSYYRVAGIVGFAGGASNARMVGNVTISNCVNNATVTSTLGASTYNTAAGILSTSNQFDEGATLIVENNKNYGTINGQVSGGIISTLFSGGSQASHTIPNPNGGNDITVYDDGYADGSKGTVIIRNNENHGAINALHKAGYQKGEYVDNVKLFAVETGARAAGIISVQVHQENTFVYGNWNTGALRAKDEEKPGEATERQIAYATERSKDTGLGYLVGWKEWNAEQKSVQSANYYGESKQVVTDEKEVTKEEPVYEDIKAEANRDQNQ